jgi:transposase
VVELGHDSSCPSIADHVLDDMSSLFDEMYAETGRPSVPPERLLKSMVLMALYTIRSERQFCEQLDYNLLFRWFLGMNMVEDSFDASTFSKNRERLMAHEVAYVFFHSVVEKAREAHLMSAEHFTVDGTLIEAWASLKSFKPKAEAATEHRARNRRKAKRRRARRSKTRQRSGSSSVRKRVEEIFGWAKTVGGFRRTRFKGKARTQLAAYVVGAAYNLTRMSRLLAM